MQARPHDNLFSLHRPPLLDFPLKLSHKLTPMLLHHPSKFETFPSNCWPKLAEIGKIEGPYMSQIFGALRANACEFHRRSYSLPAH